MGVKQVRGLVSPHQSGATCRSTSPRESHGQQTTGSARRGRPRRLESGTPHASVAAKGLIRWHHGARRPGGQARALPQQGSAPLMQLPGEVPPGGRSWQPRTIRRLAELEHLLRRRRAIQPHRRRRRHAHLTKLLHGWLHHVRPAGCAGSRGGVEEEEAPIKPLLDTPERGASSRSREGVISMLIENPWAPSACRN